ncbi:MAG: tetratricopeptide repeat protein [Microcoleaceae cyanobacterium]
MLSRLGQVYTQQKQWENAILVYQNAIELQPDSGENYHYYGDALLNLEKWSEAVDCYQHSIELNPDFTGSYWHQAIACSKLGNWGKVWDCYQAIESKQPEFLQAHRVEVQTYIEIGDYFMNKEDWDSAICHPARYAIAVYRKVHLLQPQALEIKQKIAQALKKRAASDWAEAEKILSEKG